MLHDVWKIFERNTYLNTCKMLAPYNSTCVMGCLHNNNAIPTNAQHYSYVVQMDGCPLYGLLSGS